VTLVATVVTRKGAVIPSSRFAESIPSATMNPVSMPIRLNTTWTIMNVFILDNITRLALRGAPACDNSGERKYTLGGIACNVDLTPRRSNRLVGCERAWLAASFKPLRYALCMKASCPICRKPTASEMNADFPFCGERCRLLDLGNWASEKYVITEPAFDESMFEDLERDAPPSDADEQG